MNIQTSPVSPNLPAKKTLAKNVLYNFLGYGSPLLFALILIPPLIKTLGDERFGILSIAWMILGYFSLLDFGIGRSLTKIIAEKIALNFSDQVPGLFWTSIFFMFLVSSIAAVVILFLVPFLVENFFNMSENVKEETLYSFYALGYSIPVIATTAALRGVLEAYQKFFAINIVRIFLGVFTFLGPVLVLLIVNSLFWIIIVMILVRLIVWITYFYMCLKVNSTIQNDYTISFKVFKPVLKFSIWISIANIVGPIISYSDRIIIGGAISAAAITYYSTPYEVVTKLLLIPGALVGVLFPVFSASFATIPKKAKELFTKGVKYIFLIIFPAVLLLVTFASDILNIWLGETFAANSTSVMQYLSIGILMNSLSLIPNIFFQSTGKPHVPTLLNLMELPLYIVGMWLMISNNGIEGAAFFYMIAAAIDAFMMYLLAYKIFRLRFNSVFPLIFLVICILLLLIMITVQSIVLKLIFSLTILASFIYVVWKYFLSEDERIFFVSKIRSVKIG